MKITKKIFISLLFMILMFNVSAQDDLSKQLWKNFNFGWDVYKNEDYRWRNSFIGTAYVQNFEALPAAWWSAGLRINWSKYTLYPAGEFGMGGNKANLKTTSLSIPAQLGYQVYQHKGMGMSLYTGPSFELLLGSKLDGYPYDNINHFQTGWTFGSTLQFLYLLRARVAYTYYPTSLLSEKNLPRKAITFSIGF